MLKILGIPLSVHTRKAIVAALFKGLEHEIVPVVPVDPANLPADWRGTSPTGRIPALVDGDFRVADSAAICAYLERLRPTPSLYPQPDRAYATALAFEQYAGHLFATVVHPLFHETVINPKMRGVPTDAARVASVLDSALPEAFGHLDTSLTSDFLAGGMMSVADIAVTSNLVNFRYLGFDLDRGRYPRLRAHFDRMLTHAALGEALRREEPFVDSMGLDRSWHVPHR